MTREAFIRKWLANPQKQYTEQHRDEMRDDLDLVIEKAKFDGSKTMFYVADELGQMPQIDSIKR